MSLTRFNFTRKEKKMFREREKKGKKRKLSTRELCMANVLHTKEVHAYIELKKK